MVANKSLNQPAAAKNPFSSNVIYIYIYQVIEISDKRNPITTLQFVMLLNFFLIFVVVITNFDLLSIFTALSIGIGFNAGMIHIKDVFQNDSDLVIKNAFGFKKIVPINNIVKLVRGKHIARTYTLHYIEKSGKFKEASFYPKKSGFLKLKNHPKFKEFYNEYFVDSNM